MKARKELAPFAVHFIHPQPKPDSGKPGQLQLPGHTDILVELGFGGWVDEKMKRGSPVPLGTKRLVNSYHSGGKCGLNIRIMEMGSCLAGEGAIYSIEALEDGGQRSVTEDHPGGEIEMDKTFSGFDKFGLEPFADKLTTYLRVESQFVDESFVLSLNSEFGSGKSTFFEMWANKLKAAGNIFDVVFINGWESDFQGDPLLAIVSSLLDIPRPRQEIEPIKQTAGKLCKFALSISNDVVQKLTGVDLIKAGQYAESNGGIAKPEAGSACFELYEERLKLFKELRNLLRNLTLKAKQAILIIVDELDRCRPNYAIEFLETIKHIFDIKGLIFVIGVDKNQLASSAKALFGQQLVFDEYYRKFAHRDVNLPVKSEPMTKQFCEKTVAEYLSDEAFGRKNRFPYAKLDDYRREDIVELCVAFSLNARQIHEFFRITAHVLSSTAKSDSRLLWGWQVGTFFMTALSIKNRALYDQIGRRSISLPEFTTFLKKFPLLNKRDDGAFLWPALLYLGAFSDRPADELEKEFENLGVWDSSGKEQGAFQQELARFAQGFSQWGDMLSEPAFSKIYQTLEDLRTFAGG